MQSKDQLSVVTGKAARNGAVKHAVQHEDNDLLHLQTSQKVLKEKLDSPPVVDDCTFKESNPTFTTAEKSLLKSYPEKFPGKEREITEQLRNEEDVIHETLDAQKSHSPNTNECYLIKLGHCEERKTARVGPEEHDEEKAKNSNKPCDTDTLKSFENSNPHQTSGTPEPHTFSSVPFPTDESTTDACPTEHDESEKQEEKIISACRVDSIPDDVSNNGWALKSTLSKKLGSKGVSEVTTRKRFVKVGPTEHDEHALPREPTENDDDDSSQFYDSMAEGGQGDELFAAGEQSPSPDDNTSDTHQNQKDLTEKTQPLCESTESFGRSRDPPLTVHRDEFTHVRSWSSERPAQPEKVCAREGSDRKAVSLVARVNARGGENKESHEWQRQLATELCHKDGISWTGTSADCQRKCTRAQKQQACRDDRSGGNRQQRAVTRMGRSHIASNSHFVHRKLYQPGSASQEYSQQTRTSTAYYGKGKAKNILEFSKMRAAATTSRKSTQQLFKSPANSKNKSPETRQPGSRVTPKSDVIRGNKVTRNLKHKFKIKRLQGPEVSGKINSSNDLRPGSSPLSDDRAFFWASSQQHPQFDYMHASSSRRKPDPTGRTGHSSRSGNHHLSHFAAASSQFLDMNPSSLRAIGEASEIEYQLLLPGGNPRNSLQSRPMFTDLNRLINRQQHPSENDYNNSSNNDSDIVWQYEPRNIHRGSSQVHSHDTNNEPVPRGLLSETGCSSVKCEGPLPADFPTCPSQAQLPASSPSQPESDNFDVNVHRGGPRGRSGETPACPNALRAVRLRRQAVWEDGQPAVNLQTWRPGREGSIVDLQTLDVDMHSPLHEAEQGFTGEVRYMNNLQIRNEEGPMSMSSPISLEQNPWTLLTTHFRESSLEGRETIPCCMCEDRTANAIFFNCHHVVVCNLCATDLEFCPLIHCAAAVMCFMRIM